MFLITLLSTSPPSTVSFETIGFSADGKTLYAMGYDESSASTCFPELYDLTDIHQPQKVDFAPPPSIPCSRLFFITASPANKQLYLSCHFGLAIINPDTFMGIDTPKELARAYTATFSSDRQNMFIGDGQHFTIFKPLVNIRNNVVQNPEERIIQLIKEDKSMSPQKRNLQCIPSADGKIAFVLKKADNILYIDSVDISEPMNPNRQNSVPVKEQKSFGSNHRNCLISLSLDEKSSLLYL